MRDPSVTFGISENNGNYLILNLPDRVDTQVIHLDKEKGSPSFKGIFGHDIFSTKEDAIRYIKRINSPDNVVFYEYYMVAGMFQLGNASIICFITKVKFSGLYLNKHQVFTIENVKYAIANQYNLSPNEHKALSQISSYPISHNHFICNSFDLSTPIGINQTDDCVWNKFISKQFDFFPLGRICPKIIQGNFYFSECGDFKLYHICRVVCESCGPVNAFRGTTKMGSIGNMASNEIIFTKKLGESLEFWSGFIFRGSTPIAFIPGKLLPEQDPYSSIPVWIHRTFQTYSIDDLHIYDFTHFGCKSSECFISKAMNDSIKFIKNNFNINLVQFDWHCANKNQFIQKPSNINVLNKLIQTMDNLFKSKSLTHGYIDRNIINTDKKQDFCVFVTSPNGLDRCSISSFIMIMRMINKMCIDFNIERSLITSILGFIASTVIMSSDTIAQLSVGTESVCHNEISYFISQQQNSKSNKQRDNMIYIERKRGSYEDQAKLFTLEIFEGKQNKKTNTSHNVITRCVSELPNAFVVSPQCGSSILKFKRTTYNNSEGPLIILLPEPCFIREVIIQVPCAEEHLSTPSSFSLYGGPYINRLFPIFEDQAIPTSNTNSPVASSTSAGNRITLSYKYSEAKHYSHECCVSTLSLIRFAVFEFKSPTNLFAIDGIKIYASPNLPQQPQRPQIQLPPLLDKAEFSEDPSHETSIQWEERRLCALMPLNDYLFKISKKEMNPGVVLSDNIFKLMPSLIDNDNQAYVCASCGRRADFKCALCRKTFCYHCEKPNDSHDFINDPHNICKLCSSCMDKRFKLSSSLTRLIALNTRMANILYDFITNEEGKYYATDPILSNQVSIGQNNVSVEKMMQRGEPWEPYDLMNRLDFIFKQAMKITAINIQSTTPLHIIVNDHNAFDFIPPSQHLEISLTCQVITLVIIGENISITKIDFDAKPTEPITSIVDRILPSAQYKLIKTKTNPHFASRRQNIIPLFEGKVTQICGLEISEIAPVKSFICIVSSEGGQKYFRFCVPKLRGPFRFILPILVDCSVFTIWYTEVYEAFSMPQVMLFAKV